MEYLKKIKQMQLPILNIGSLKTAIEEEWKKISEEFILMVCQYNNWKKNGGHIE